jgi:hypothetical protein
MSLVVFSVISVTLLMMYRFDVLPRFRRRVDATAGGRSNPYPAVSIRCAGGCEAAQSIKGRRFLGAEAPALPLENCTAETCHCRYVHHVDRRTGILDRRRVRGQDDESLPTPDRVDQREGRGRRASDWIAAYQLNIPQS